MSGSRYVQALMLEAHRTDEEAARIPSVADAPEECLDDRPPVVSADNPGEALRSARETGGLTIAVRCLEHDLVMHDSDQARIYIRVMQKPMNLGSREHCHLCAATLYRDIEREGGSIGGSHARFEFVDIDTASTRRDGDVSRP